MRKLKKTLIIHASDPSTDFLKPIYKGMQNKTVVNGGLTKTELTDLIKSHDKIMMMGHGWTSGLFNTGHAQFKTGGLVIGMEDVELLKTKECVFIWCMAHQFVERHKLTGFHTDMFVSEVGEAQWFDMNVTQEQVDESNNGFVNIFRKYRALSAKDMLKKTKAEYAKIAEKNEVAQYNYERLYNNT